jgi:hypothetical protein
VNFFIVLLLMSSTFIFARMLKVSSLFEVKFITIWFLIFSYIGSFVLFFRLDNSRFLMGVTDKNILLTMILSILISITILFLISTFLSGSLGIKQLPVETVCIKTSINLPVKLYLVGIALYTFYMLKNYLNNFDGNFLLYMIGIGNFDATSRSTMTNNFSGSYSHFKTLLFDVNLFLILFLRSVNVRSAFISTVTIYFIMSFLVFGLSSGEKGPVIVFALSLVILKIRKENIGISFKAVRLITLLVCLLLAIYYFVAQIQTPMRILQAMLSRVFTGELTPLYFAFEMLWSGKQLYYFDGLANPGGLLPINPISISTEVYKFMHPEMVDLGVYGSAPTIFWYEGLLSFGFTGAIVQMLIFPVLLTLALGVTRLYKSAAVKLAASTYTLVHFMGAVGVGFNQFLFDTNLYSVLFVALLLDLSLRTRVLKI